MPYRRARTKPIRSARATAICDSSITGPESTLLRKRAEFVSAENRAHQSGAWDGGDHKHVETSSHKAIIQSSRSRTFDAAFSTPHCVRHFAIQRVPAALPMSTILKMVHII